MHLPNIEDTLAAWPPLARLVRNVSRRDFLKFTTIAGSGLTLGVFVPAIAKNTGLTVLGVEGSPGDYSTPFVRIDPDNTVTVICKHVEAGLAERQILVVRANLTRMSSRDGGQHRLEISFYPTTL